MHAVILIAQAIPEKEYEPLPEKPQKGICCVTGIETETIRASKLFSSNFCDWNLLAAPTTGRVGVETWRAMQYGSYGVDEETGKVKKRKKKPEMQACWWTDGIKFIVIGKKDIRQMVLAGIPDSAARSWAGWVTTSYKKHGALRAPVNSGGYGAWGFDDMVVDAGDIIRVREWWKCLRQAQNMNISRTSMETGEIAINVMSKIGIDVWQEFENWAGMRRRSPLFSFLVYLLPSQQELKEGYTDADLHD